MKARSVNEIAAAVGGRVLMGDGERLLRNISLDSRKMAGDDLFVPIVGERVDAHRFICQALETGAAAAFTSAHSAREEVQAELAAWEAAGGDGERLRDCAWIGVEDTKKALQDLGSYCREKLSIPVVGITGSVGKTTTREMIAAALGAGFSVYRTPGNSNSQVGVPITMCSIPETAGIAVIELGMSEPGEMERIARVARVDCAVMTNIGVAHIEQLGSQENILREKLKIQEGMPQGGTLFLNGDDPLLAGVTAKEGIKTVLYGQSPECACRAEEVRLEEGYPAFTAVCGGKRVPVRLGVMGLHMVSNALAALAMAQAYGVPLEGAAAELEKFRGFQGRQQIFECRGVTVLDDSYNASPVSMKAGLQVLSSMKPGARKIAVLADMKELGPEGPKFHRQIGYYLAEHPVDQVLLLGELAKEIQAGMVEKGAKGAVRAFDRLEDVGRWLKEETRAGDCILLKGSNSMRLGALGAEFREEPETRIKEK